MGGAFVMGQKWDTQTPIRLTPRGDATIAIIASIIIVVMLATAFTVGQHLRHNRIGLIPPVVCQEDMGCWNCTTMGNKECGP